LIASPPRAGNWVERYEALRAHAVGEGRLGFMPLGLAVLRHRGVVAWMEVEGRVVERAVAGPVASVEDEGTGSAPTPTRSELVNLLASTALLVAAGGLR
jgi:hypothetical protein